MQLEGALSAIEISYYGNGLAVTANLTSLSILSAFLDLDRYLRLGGLILTYGFFYHHSIEETLPGNETQEMKLISFKEA